MRKFIALFSLVIFLGVAAAPLLASNNTQINVELKGKKCPTCGKKDCTSECETTTTKESEKAELKSIECKEKCSSSCEKEGVKSTADKKSTKDDKKKKGVN